MTASSRQAAARRAKDKPRRVTRLRFIAGQDSTGAVAAAIALQGVADHFNIASIVATANG